MKFTAVGPGINYMPQESWPAGCHQVHRICRLLFHVLGEVLLGSIVSWPNCSRSGTETAYYWPGKCSSNTETSRIWAWRLVQRDCRVPAVRAWRREKVGVYTSRHGRYYNWLHKKSWVVKHLRWLRRQISMAAIGKIRGDDSRVSWTSWSENLWALTRLVVWGGDRGTRMSEFA